MAQQSLVNSLKSGFKPKLTENLRDVYKYPQKVQPSQPKMTEQEKKAQEYNKLFTAPDFQTKAAEAASYQNPTQREAEGWLTLAGYKLGAKEVKNPVTYSKKYANELAMGAGTSADLEGDYRYTFMTKDEEDLYNYILASQGKKKGQEFLDYLEEALNARWGQRTAKNIQAIESPIERGIISGLSAFGAGVEETGTGIKQIFSKAPLPVPMGTVLASELEKGATGIGKTALQVTRTVGQMTPGILLSTLTGGAGAIVGAGTMGASAYGNAYADALRQGKTEQQARNYGLLTGVSEGALQYLLGGVTKLGGKLFSTSAKTLVNSIDNVVLRVAADTGINMTKEFSEEYLQQFLNPVFKNITLDEKNDIKFFTEENLYAGLMGALTAGLIEGGSNISSQTHLNSLGNGIKQSGNAETVINAASQMNKNTEAYKMASRVTPESSGAKIGDLYVQYIKDGGDAQLLSKSIAAKAQEAALTEAPAPEAAAEAAPAPAQAAAPTLTTDEKYNRDVADKQTKLTQLERQLGIETASLQLLNNEFRENQYFDSIGEVNPNFRPDLTERYNAQRQKIDDLQRQAQAARDDLATYQQRYQADIASQQASVAAQDDIAEIKGIVQDFANRPISEDALREIESIGQLQPQVKELRRAFDKAKRIQQRVTRLNKQISEADSLQQASEIQKNLNAANAQLDRAANDLMRAQEALLNYGETPVVSQETIPSATPGAEAAAPAAPAAPTAAETTPTAAPAGVAAPAAASTTPIVTAPTTPSTEATAAPTAAPGTTGVIQPGQLPGAAQAAPARAERPAPAGAIPPGEVERGFSSNIRTDINMAPEIRAEFEETPETYTRLSNETTLAKAREKFNADPDTAYRDLTAKIAQVNAGKGRLSPDDVPLSRMLANNLARQNRISDARALISDVALILTESGQLGQAANILRNADPVSVQNTIQKAIDKINSEMESRGLKYRAELTQAEIDEINATDFSNTEDNSAFQGLYDRIARRIGTEMGGKGSTIFEKAMELRRISMLLNPKTQIKNFFGNVPTLLLRKGSEKLSSALQDAFVGMGIMPKEQQTRTLKVKDTHTNLAKEVFAARKDEIINGSNKWDMSQLLKNYRKIWKDAGIGKLGNNLRTFTYNLLEKGDYPFLKSAYVDNLAQYMAAHNINSVEDVTPQALEFAMKQAYDATFKSANEIARLLNAAKKQGLIGQGIDVIFPYTTTPLNIAKTTYEYSPFGILNLVGDIQSKNGAKIIDTLSKSLTGSGAVALGFLLKSLGAITGARDKDPDKAQYDIANGKSPYSFGGKVSYDWLQPFGSLLAMGAATYDASSQKEGALDKIWQSITSSGDAFLNMSFFKTIYDLARGYKSPTETLLTTIASGVASQYTPSMFGALTRTIDETVRSTKGAGPLASAASRLPLVSGNLPPAVSIRGEEVKRIENPVYRALYELASPANININVSTPVDNEINRLYEVFKDKTLIPRTAETNVDGKALTGEQIAQYQKTMGQNTYKLLTGIINTPEYKALTDTQKAKLISDNILNYSSDRARQEYRTEQGTAKKSDWDDEAQRKNLGIDLIYKVAVNDTLTDKKGNPTFTALVDRYNQLPEVRQNEILDQLGETRASTFTKVLEAMDNKISPTTYFQLSEFKGDAKADKDEDGKTISGSAKAKVLDYINSFGLTPEQKDAMYRAFGYGEKDIGKAPWN